MATQFREGTPDDVRPAYAMFRRSLWDYLWRTAILRPGDPVEPDVEAAWGRQGDFIEHLARTAAHFWVATGDDGAIIGMARSIQRGPSVELTEFFVDPTAQSRGVGRGLLERAFPLGWGEHRSIIATLDPRALALYLRFGVRETAVVGSFDGMPRVNRLPTDLEFSAGSAVDAAAILEIDARVVGASRPEDVAYFLATRPLVVARRDGRAVGYGFGQTTRGGGPAAALDPTDLLPLLAELEATAAEAELTSFETSIGLSNGPAVRHLLERGFRLDPFFALLLESEPTVQVDRYLMTNPNFIV